MGKGDIKSRKGKMANGSFGKKRLRNETMPKAVAPEPVAKAEKVEKAPKAEKPKAKKAEK